MPGLAQGARPALMQACSLQWRLALLATVFSAFNLLLIGQYWRGSVYETKTNIIVRNDNIHPGNLRMAEISVPPVSSKLISRSSSLPPTRSNEPNSKRLEMDPQNNDEIDESLLSNQSAATASTLPIIVESPLFSEAQNKEKPVLLLTWFSLGSSAHRGAHKLFTTLHLDKTCHNSLMNPSDCAWIEIECDVACVLTGNRSLSNEADLFLFHMDYWQGGRYDMKAEISLGKRKDQLYAVYGHEPTWRAPRMWQADVIKQFDMAFHWAFGADVPNTFYYFDRLHFGQDPGPWWLTANVDRWEAELPSRVELSKAMYISRQQRTMENGTSSLTSPYDKDMTGVPALVSAMVTNATVSNCGGKSRPTFFKAFLESEASVASFGHCFHNANDSSHKPAMSGRSFEFRLKMEEKVSTIAQYPFHLAMESTQLERGFVTEKIFQCFFAGTIPIYFGHQEAKEYLPPHSFIDVNDFRSVADLSRYVLNVASNYTLFMQYHAWRKGGNNTVRIFEHFQKISRQSAACRLCKYWDEANKMVFAQRKGAAPEGQLYYHPAIGWARLKPNAPVYTKEMTDSEFQDLPMDEISKWLMPGEYERLRIDKIAGFSHSAWKNH